MRTIKRFTGNIPPSLKMGETATNGSYFFVGALEKPLLFERVFDWEVDQEVAGFEYTVASGFTVPAGTSFSRLQELFNTLPKNIKTGRTQISIKFETGTYINDMGKDLVIPAKDYRIGIYASSIIQGKYSSSRNVKFVYDNKIKIDCEIYIRGIEFEALDNHALTVTESIYFRMRDCSVNMKSNFDVFSNSYARKADFEFYRVRFSLYSDWTRNIFSTVAGRISLTDCASDTLKRPLRLAGSIQSFLIAIDSYGMGFQSDSTLHNEYFGIHLYQGQRLGTSVEQPR